MSTRRERVSLNGISNSERTLYRSLRRSGWSRGSANNVVLGYVMASREGLMLVGESGWPIRTIQNTVRVKQSPGWRS